MSETATANPPSWAPWRSLLTWAPFQIDALGLITLLGAEEVNASVGRLVRSTWVEYLPLLGAYVIANESFREKQAGYHLYNISKGIQTTDFAPWFSRWIRAQDFEQTRSFVRWTVEKRQDERLQQVAGISLCVSGIGVLLAVTVLSYDWYGFANALSMLASVLVRSYMVRSLRQAIDKQVEASVPEDQKHILSASPSRSDETHSLNQGWLGSPSKILIITADARAVTMLVPGQLMRPPSPFIARLNPLHRFWYSVMRWLGWIAFAVQVISLGMAQLATQLITVFLMVLPTVLHVSKLGCDDSHWLLHIRHAWKKLCAWPGKPNPQKASDVEKAKSDSKARVEKNAKFEFKYACWIGKYLKAEIYEWPPNHNYTVDPKTPTRYKPYEPGDDRSEKRQLLYAWLQLSTDEIESIDKWDLFPHSRQGQDEGWLQDYQWGQKHIEELNVKGQGITAIMDRASTVQTTTEAQKPPGTTTSTRPSSANTTVQTNGRPGPLRVSADGHPIPPPGQSPVSATLTSPEGVTTSPENLMQPGSAAADNMAAQVPVLGIVRQGTVGSLNSANYVSETAQDAARARRQSHGDLAFPGRPGLGRAASQAP